MSDKPSPSVEVFVGQTLTGVSMKTYTSGDEYVVLHFGPNRYEFLAWFTANDHQVAVAAEALEAIRDFGVGTDGSSYSQSIRTLADEALKKMETFKR